MPDLAQLVVSLLGVGDVFLIEGSVHICILQPCSFWGPASHLRQCSTCWSTIVNLVLSSCLYQMSHAAGLAGQSFGHLKGGVWSILTYQVTCTDAAPLSGTARTSCCCIHQQMLYE